ncbi:MAG: glyceraldehyde 3-phosphate dehydrogenase NAD-binding domain-containing protein [Candidatus Babeliales bacterium]|nr:glyceraldehyde 3-phosphate dehydrogenase NAD-binding domain-containing protein [Candidatus Babeliales bacterium]
MIKIAINGFGRIGRTFLRTILADEIAQENIEVKVINVGPDNSEHALHLFKYDTLMGTYQNKLSSTQGQIKVGNYSIKVIAETDPSKIDWKGLDVDLVVECTGKFTDADKAKIHINAGAKYVLISAPAKDEDITIIPGVNDEMFDSKKHKIISLGSCTTNAVAPLIKVINDAFSITSAFITTAHAYTATQNLLDNDKKDLRLARAAALNIIPSTTGAAKVVGKIFPELNTVIKANSLRVPVADVSFIDLTFVAKKAISINDIHAAFINAKDNNLNGILDITLEPLVSSDFKGNSHSVILDSLLTETIGNMGKVSGWYDNEWGYSCRLRDFIKSNSW